MITLMQRDPTTADMVDRLDYLGNLGLLIVGGNDYPTPSGGVLALVKIRPNTINCALTIRNPSMVPDLAANTADSHATHCP